MSIFRTPLSRTTPIAAAMALSLVLAACGSDEPARSQLPEPAVTAVAEPVGDGTVIGTANMGGTVVDPQPHTIDDLMIQESYPESLAITFTGGDAGCTAADARAIADGDTVRIELEVGITEDALTKSCVAGDVQHRLSIPLSEGLDGRTVSLGV